MLPAPLIRACAAFLLLASLAAAAWAQERRAEYLLAPGDAVRIQIFQHPDLSLETRISENNAITFPLIGSARIGGLSLPDAEQVIAKALRAGGFLNQPQVIIVLQQNRGNQVSVLGNVNRPGRYPLDIVGMRLTEIIATAGGIAATGADVVIVSGIRDGKPFRQEVDLAAIFLAARPDDDLVLSSGDTLYVDRNPVFYIYGEIQRPGAYRVERGMTLRQAIASSGGLAPRGTERGLALYRRGPGGAIETVSGPGLNDPVRADDVIHVQQSLF